MRNFSLFGAKWGNTLASLDTGSFPEVMRLQAIGNTARIFIVVALVGMFPAVYGLVSGSGVAFILAASVLAGGLIALSMVRAGRYDAAAAANVTVLMASGLVLSVADRALVDAGLAVALLGPVLAVLTTKTRLRVVSWIMLAPILMISISASLLGLPRVMDSALALQIAGMLAFVVSCGIVTYSAHCVSQRADSQEKAQMNAYRHLVEHVQDAVLRFGTDGIVLLASRASESLFGCPRYQISGRGLGERLHVLDRPVFLTAFADASEGRRSRTIEARVRQEDPRSNSNVPRFVWCEIQLSPILEEEAKAGRHDVIGLLRDITARKDAEVTMSEARRAAEDASQAKSRFLATIGHELRTPLNAVVGFSEMMTSGIGGELSPSHMEYATLIKQSGRHLLDVVGMLLDMSRIEAGKFEIHAEPLVPAEIVPACVSMVDTMAQERRVSLRTDVEQGLPTLHADERVCRQILINLLSNAIKFSHEGGDVAVSVKRQGQSINISVRDNGIGMAPAALARIGEPFFQVQDGLNRTYEGTGLGLSIVKGMVELHGGTLRAMSEIGAGTTITVLLPIAGPNGGLETAEVLPLHREPQAASTLSWPSEKRKAQ
ncbi:PAS domain-containing sensor histidine kinase [Devosia sp. MC1541]|uniref:PAS domain-containing sensor histidine kinase n=1 Tax=Devosia sp. MC1541 TaxID=2725264 RepID=UPI00145F614C|nr:PAS domain-containing sensor histidine kinase [Devosia sp. MC1541]